MLITVACAARAARATRAFPASPPQGLWLLEPLFH